MQKICIVVPCYNEADRLPLEKFSDCYKSTNYTFLFVDDGSTDNTYNLLECFSKSRPGRVFVKKNKKNRGKAEAVRQGMLMALDIGDFDIIGFLDADLATPLTEVAEIITHINGKIIFAFGSRIKKIGSNIERKLYRHILGRFFATIFSNLLQIGVYDTQCGAKFFHLSVVKDVFGEEFISKWIFDVEVLMRLTFLYKGESLHGVAQEVPIRYWKDIAGSKIKLAHFVKILSDLWKLREFSIKNR